MRKLAGRASHRRDAGGRPSRHYQEREQPKRRQHQVLETEGTVLPFVPLAAVESEVVGRPQSEWLAKTGVLDHGLRIEKREQGVAGLPPGDGVGRRRNGDQKRGCQQARLPAAPHFEGGEWQRRRDKCQGAELGRHGGAEHDRGGVERPRGAGLAEMPQGYHRA